MTIQVLIANDHPIVRAGVWGELTCHVDTEGVSETTNNDKAAQQTETSPQG
jgi:DNA-binding NarL/FixJ family response regulator